jgi:hypothetical protein
LIELPKEANFWKSLQLYDLYLPTSLKKPS